MGSPNTNVGTTTALADGSSTFATTTAKLPLGDHFVRVRQVFNGHGSIYSLVKTVEVSLLTNPGADLDGDGVVDIKDWSIFLSRWGSSDSAERRRDDINGDGTVDIADFSTFCAPYNCRILLRYILI